MGRRGATCELEGPRSHQFPKPSVAGITTNASGFYPMDDPPAKAEDRMTMKPSMSVYHGRAVLAAVTIAARDVRRLDRRRIAAPLVGAPIFLFHAYARFGTVSAAPFIAISKASSSSSVSGFISVSHHRKRGLIGRRDSMRSGLSEVQHRGGV